MTLTHKDRGRFESFFYPGKVEECWIWLGAKDKDGYGTFSLQNVKNKAHRISYFLEYGQYDENLQVLHICDVPSCINPYHLFLGTQIDNTRDMILKNRQAKGEMNAATKISDPMTGIVRELYQSQEYTIRQIAEISGLGKSQICNIINLKSRIQ